MTEDQIQKKIAWHERQILRFRSLQPSTRERLDSCGKAGKWWREYFVPGGEGVHWIDTLRLQNPNRLHFLDVITPCCLPVFSLLLQRKKSDGLTGGPARGVRTQAVLFAVAMSEGLTLSEVAAKTRMEPRATATRLGRLRDAGILVHRDGKWLVDHQDFRDWCQMRYGRKRPAEGWHGGDLNCTHTPTDAMLCDYCGWVPKHLWTSHKSCGRCMETRGLGTAAAAPLLKRELKVVCAVCGAVKE